MLKISKKTSYGLQTVLYLAKTNDLVSAKKIAQAEHIPYSFLEQIVFNLRQSGLIKAQRGAAGGYKLAKNPQDISLGDVIRALEEDVLLMDCLVNSHDCPNFDTCLAKTGWLKLQQAISNSVDNITLQELITTNSQAMNRIYLDYAATTPVDPQVLQAMKPYFFQNFGNPASIHWAGVDADQAVSAARKYLAQTIKANPQEIFFTSSATESNNLAIKGVASANKTKRHKIIISTIEHDCVLNSAKWLETQGYQVEMVPVDKYGEIKLAEFKKMIDSNTLLVSVIHASNEIGTIQPIDQIGEICQKLGVIFHTDAAQSYTKVPLDVNKANIDLLTTSAHKIYGPKGVSFLYKRQGIKINPLLHGGDQELKLRSSTLNVPAIVGFAQAAKIAFSQYDMENQRIKKLRDWLQQELLSTIPNSYINGHPTRRLVNNLNLRFDFVEGEALVLGLDLQAVATSTGSACSSPKLEPSHVLTATGLSHPQAHGSLRLSLGRYTTQQQVEQVAKILPTIVANLRAISPYKI